MWLDVLCMSGKIIWGRFRPFAGNSNHLKGPTPIKTTPITLVDRNNLQLWSQLSDRKNGEKRELSDRARQIWKFLKQQGASFFNDLMEKNSMLKIKVEEAISELVSHGLVTSDSFTGLRALLVPTKYRLNSQRRRKKASFEMEEAGRWSLIDRPETSDPNVYELNQQFCQVLLRRYGVIFRKLAEQESMAPPWRELVKVLRRMEAKGQIRGGRFVNGVWGEQYALPEAIVQLRKARRAPKKGTLIAISAADPLNLIGIITPERKIPAYMGNRILFRDGEAIVIKENKELHFLKEPDQREKWKLQNALVQRNISPRPRAYLGRGIS